MSRFKKQCFISSTPRGSDFSFSASETGSHNADGTVTFNDNGQCYYYYDSIEDYSNHEFLGETVPFKTSLYVGDRDDNGVITWLNEAYSEAELDKSEDGSCVYTAPKYITSLSKEVEEQIMRADAFDLLEMIIANKELLNDARAFELIKERDKHLAAHGC
jgi:hypothetical protein